MTRSRLLGTNTPRITVALRSETQALLDMDKTRAIPIGSHSQRRQRPLMSAAVETISRQRAIARYAPNSFGELNVPTPRGWTICAAK